GLSQSQVRRRLFRPRVIAYTLLLLVIGIGLIVSIATRSTLRVDVIRDRGALGREVAGGLIENVYRLQVINTSESPLTLQLDASGVPGMVVTPADHPEQQVVVEGSSNRLVPVVVQAPAAGAAPGLYDIQLQVTATSDQGRRTVVTEASSFYVPR